MEHDHRVVERIAQDGEQCCDRVRGNLAANQRVDAHHDDEVVQQRHNGDDAHLVLEADGDIGNDQQKRYRERDGRRLDNALTPVRANRGNLIAVGVQVQRGNNAVGQSAGLFGGSGARAHQEALRAVGGSGLNHSIRLAGIAERCAHVLDGNVLGVVERDRGAAHELDAELKALHANRCDGGNHQHCRKGKEHLADTKEVDVALDEAPLQLIEGLVRKRFLLFCCLGGRMKVLAGELAAKLSIDRGSLLAVLDAPEPGVVRYGMRRQETDKGRLQQKHHNDVAADAQCQGKAEALYRSRCQEEQRERRDKGYQVGVDGGLYAVAHARDRCGAHASAHTDLFAESLQNQDG